jgi:carboxypeptidase C (cathepsin A)
MEDIRSFEHFLTYTYTYRDPFYFSPLLINATGGFMVNPWSWTKLVNLLVIEAPMGVGYSVSVSSSSEH